MGPRTGLFLLMALASLPRAAGAQSSCDPELVRMAANSNGYRQRGNRCEGLYARQVGGTTLALVSFTEVFQPYAPGTRDTMQVEWPSGAPGDSVRLQAEFLRRGKYYRMDAVQPMKGSFIWPSGLLAYEQLPGRDLGVLASTHTTVAGAGAPLYLPLRVRTSASRDTPCGDFTFTLWPGTRLDSVFVSLAPLNAQGRPGTPIRDKQPLTSGPYFAEYPIVFKIPRTEIQVAGTYQLEVSARLPGNSTASPNPYYVYLSPACGT